MSKTIARKTTDTVKAAKASPKARKAAPSKPAVVLPDGYKQFNRTSLTAAYRRLSGDAKAAKFATRDEGRKALEALASA